MLLCGVLQHQRCALPEVSCLGKQGVVPEWSVAVGMASLQCFLGADAWEGEALETQGVFLSACEYQVDLGPHVLHF